MTDKKYNISMSDAFLKLQKGDDFDPEFAAWFKSHSETFYLIHNSSSHRLLYGYVSRGRSKPQAFSDFFRNFKLYSK